MFIDKAYKTDTNRSRHFSAPQCNKEILKMLKKMTQVRTENNNPLSKGLEKFKKTDNQN